MDKTDNHHHIYSASSDHTENVFAVMCFFLCWWVPNSRQHEPSGGTWEPFEAGEVWPYELLISKEGPPLPTFIPTQPPLNSQEQFDNQIWFVSLDWPPEMPPRHLTPNYMLSFPPILETLVALTAVRAAALTWSP